MNLKIFSQYLFLVFVFLLPLQMIYLLREPFVGGVKWEYGVVALYGTDLLLGIFLISVLISWLRSIKYTVLSIKYGGVEVMLSLLLLWAGISIFWAGDQMLALYFFIKLLLAAGLFFVVRSWADMDMKKVVFVLLAAGVLQSGIGIAQFVSQQSIDSSILGMSAHEASQAGSSVLKIDSGRFLRAYGTFPHPNVLGGFLGAILVLVIGFFSFHPSSILPLERGGGIIFLACAIIILLGLMLTFSRSAWMGTALGIVALGALAFRQKGWESRGRFFKIIAALGLAGIVFGFILHDQIFPRFDMATIEREGSVSERVASLQDAKTLIKEHPLVGVGAGNFTAAVMKGDEMGVKGEMGPRPVWSIQPAHNVFILVWAELGIIGFILFGGFLVFSLLLIQKSKIKNQNSAILIALLTLIPSLFLDHFLWSSHLGLLFFFLLLGFATRR